MRSDPAIAQVAARIREIRLAAGVSQVALARESGLDLRTITRIESVEREPSLSTVFRIAWALDVEVAELLAGIP